MLQPRNTLRRHFEQWSRYSSSNGALRRPASRATPFPAEATRSASGFALRPDSILAASTSSLARENTGWSRQSAERVEYEQAGPSKLRDETNDRLELLKHRLALPPAEAGGLRELMRLFDQVDQLGKSHLLTTQELLEFFDRFTDLPKRTIGQYTRKDDLQALRGSGARIEQLFLTVSYLLRQRSQALSALHHRKLMKAFARLRYGPGICNLWNTCVERGDGSHFRGSDISNAIHGLQAWVAVHDTVEGPLSAEQCALSVRPTALTMLAAFTNTQSERFQIGLRLTLRILLAARDFKSFDALLKQMFGFDTSLPCAPPDPTRPRPMIELRTQEVIMVMQSFAARDRLSSMMAVFEAFDTPDESLRTFSGSRPMADGRKARADIERANVSDSRPVSMTTLEGFELLIYHATRLRKGFLARMYFDDLCRRWRAGTSSRLIRLGRQLGFTAEDFDMTVLTETEDPSYDERNVETRPSIGPRPRIHTMLSLMYLLRGHEPPSTALVTALEEEAPRIQLLSQAFVDAAQQLLDRHEQRVRESADSPLDGRSALWLSDVIKVYQGELARYKHTEFDTVIELDRAVAAAYVNLEMCKKDHRRALRSLTGNIAFGKLPGQDRKQPKGAHRLDGPSESQQSSTADSQAAESISAAPAQVIANATAARSANTPVRLHSSLSSRSLGSTWFGSRDLNSRGFNLEDVIQDADLREQAVQVLKAENAFLKAVQSLAVLRMARLKRDYGLEKPYELKFFEYNRRKLAAVEAMKLVSASLELVQTDHGTSSPSSTEAIANMTGPEVVEGVQQQQAL